MVKLPSKWITTNTNKNMAERVKDARYCTVHLRQKTKQREPRANEQPGRECVCQGIALH